MAIEGFRLWRTMILFSILSNQLALSHRCVCQAEPSVSSWGAELVDNCPATEAQMQEDKRYLAEQTKTTKGDQCANRLFRLDNGQSYHI